MAEEVKITGADDVLANLQKLDAAMQGKILKKCVKAGAVVVEATARAIAPSRSGNLKDNIRIRLSSKSKTGITKATVGVGAKDWTGPAYYATFVLWGHKAGSRKLGAGRKQIEGNDFLKKAAELCGEPAVEVMINTIAEGIEKI